jgi:hypothetical protein
VPRLSLSGTSRPASISSRRNQPRPKNKFAKRGKFSGVEKHRKTHHVSPANSPHIYHQKTTFCTPFLPKPPAKTPVIQPEEKILQNRSLRLDSGFFGEMTAAH